MLNYGRLAPPGGRLRLSCLLLVGGWLQAWRFRFLTSIAAFIFDLGRLALVLVHCCCGSTTESGLSQHRAFLIVFTHISRAVAQHGDRALDGAFGFVIIDALRSGSRLRLTVHLTLIFFFRRFLWLFHLLLLFLLRL